MQVKEGRKFGSLTVLSLFKAQRKNGKVRPMAKCICDCGDFVDVEKYNLSSGNSTRCMSCKAGVVGLSASTHGHSSNNRSSSDIEGKCYYTWQAIKRRCRKVYDSSYSRYGGRGIDVCDEWYDSYQKFLFDMGLPPSMNSQIDRIDNKRGYYIDNCRWVSRSENARNKSNNRRISAFGKSHLLCEWSEISGEKAETIARRIDHLKWSPEQAILGKESRKKYVTPDGSFLTLSEVSKFYGLSSSGSHSRFKSTSFPSWEIINH